MKSENLFDTITAISTPQGMGGISIIRVSGKNAIELSSKILSPKITTKTKIRKALLRNIITIKDKKLIDKGIITIFKAPNSYTGEDVVEISCHGGIAIPNIIIDELLKVGVRLATEGEFTKRAFLNDKIDLIQAEAVEELISAKTKEAVFLANSNIEKRFSSIIESIKYKIIDILSLIEVNIDYPEEDMDDVDYNQIKVNIESIKNTINDLIIETEKGRAIINGVKVAIIGKTNVGKSSLMNALIREERAIVSEIHGTTRDYLDAIINISGIPVTIIDTAGIRTTKDIIEELGTKKSKELINKSDLVLLLIDAETGITEEDKQIIELVENRNIVVVINKIDIKPFDKSTIEDYNFDNIIEISALKNLNINKLEEAILNKVTNLSTTNIQKEILVNTRHKNALLKVIEFLDFAEQSIENNVSYEFIALDVRRSLDYIGEITGEISTDDILDNIFKKFCVGK